MEERTCKVQKSALLSFIEGYRKTNELIKEEKRKWLIQLTAEDSLCEYDALCNMWEADPEKEGLERLESHKITFLLDRRRRFNKTGGYGEP